MELQTLQAIYERYHQELGAVQKKASPLSGFLGFGENPRKDPCHMRFYESVEQWVKDFLAGEVDAEAAYEAAHWILTTAEVYKKKPEYWFMLAAHGLCKDLIPLLSSEHCSQLELWFGGTYSRRVRTPVQEEVYKLLQKGAQK